MDFVELELKVMIFEDAEEIDFWESIVLVRLKAGALPYGAVQDADKIILEQRDRFEADQDD